MHLVRTNLKSRNKVLEVQLSELIDISKMFEEPSNNNPPGMLLNDDPDAKLQDIDDTSHEAGKKLPRGV